VIDKLLGLAAVDGLSEVEGRGTALFIAAKFVDLLYGKMELALFCRLLVETLTDSNSSGIG
jgi:hypothetical protein